MKQKIELEKVVKKNINKLLRKLWPDCWIFMPVQTGMGRHGVPDHIAIVPVEVTQEMVGATYGFAVAIEAKRPKQKPTPRQMLELMAICRTGAFANFVAGSEQIPALEIKLKDKFWLT